MPQISKVCAGPAPTISVKLEIPIPINSPRRRFSACSLRSSLYPIFSSATSIAGGAQEIISSGGLAVSCILSSGASVTVLTGGKASGTKVGSGGQVLVSSGGVATGDAIGKGGQELLSSGGKSISAIVNSGGVETVLSGAVASGTSVVRFLDRARSYASGEG